MTTIAEGSITYPTSLSGYAGDYLYLYMIGPGGSVGYIICPIESSGTPVTTTTTVPPVSGTSCLHVNGYNFTSSSWWGALGITAYFQNQITLANFYFWIAAQVNPCVSGVPDVTPTPTTIPTAYPTTVIPTQPVVEPTYMPIPVITTPVQPNGTITVETTAVSPPNFTTISPTLAPIS